MSYNFYDFNNALQQRNEYVEDRLKDGSPIVAVSFDDGILLLTLRGGQRKIFEVYDRLAMGALGKQSDVEAVRIAAIDAAHREGFERSPDDVAIQRLVGFGLSPAVKRVYNDQSAIPLTLRAVFAELGATQDKDHLFVLGYDGEFKTLIGGAIAAGTAYAEEQAEAVLKEATPHTLQEAMQTALTAWATGRAKLLPEAKKADNDYDPLDEDDAPKVADDPKVTLSEALKNGLTVEAALLQRNTRREVKFRQLKPEEISSVVSEFTN